MILLKSTDTLEVLLAGAVTTTQAPIFASYADIGDDGSTFAPGASSSATNSTTAVTWVDSPDDGILRQIKLLSLYNADTATMTVTVRVVDNGTNRILVKVSLATGERLEYTDGNGFRVLSSTGALRSEGGGSTSTLAVSTVSASGGTLTLNFGGASKAIFKTTLTGNVTSLAFSNLPGASYHAEYELHIAQDGTGSRTFAIPASHKALGGSDTAIASAASAVTVLTASTVDGGTTWRYAMQESA